MASKRVLIVDDEENIGRSLRMILEREGYAVNVCRSVAEFRRHPDAQRADAYLLDMKLPDGNGIDLLQVGASRTAPPRPAIMISGPRHHRRRGGSHARRRLRFPGKAAEPRPRAAGRQERPGAVHAAAGERAPARTGGRRAQDDRRQPGVAARGGAGHHGGALRCARAADRRIGHRQGTAGRPHPQLPARSPPARSSR